MEEKKNKKVRLRGWAIAPKNLLSVHKDGKKMARKQVKWLKRADAAELAHCKTFSTLWFVGKCPLYSLFIFTFLVSRSLCGCAPVACIRNVSSRSRYPVQRFIMRGKCIIR